MDLENDQQNLEDEILDNSDLLENNKNKKSNKDNTREKKLNDILKDNIIDNELNTPKFVYKNDSNFFQKIIPILLLVFMAVFVFFVGKSVYNSLFLNIDQNYYSSLSIDVGSDLDIEEDGSIKYFINFKNTEKFKVTDAEIMMRFPEEFEYHNSTISPSDINSRYAKWIIKNVDPGDSIKIEIDGSIFGRIGDETITSVTMNYQLDKISSNFYTASSYTSVVNNSLYDIALEKPDIIYPNKDFEYKIKIKNNQINPIYNLKLVFDYPSEFIIKEYNIKPIQEYSGEQSTWFFDFIDEKQDDENFEEEIIITGYFESADIEKGFSVQSGIIDDSSNKLSSFSVLNEKSDDINVSQVGVKFILDTSSEMENLSKFGKSIISDLNNVHNFNFSYEKQSSDININDVEIVLEFRGDDILNVPDMNFSVEPNFENFIDEETGDIVNIFKWTKNEIESFADFSSSSNLNVIFGFKNSNNLNDLSILCNSYITGIINGTTDRIKLSSNNYSFNILIKSNTSISYKTSYYDESGNQVGYGPVPPKVGQETKYRLKFDISNYVNAISGVYMKTKIPDNVFWNDIYSTNLDNKIVYNENTRELVWTVGSVSSDSSDNFLYFFVTVTPNEGDIGKNVNLTSDITFYYTDEFISKEYIVNLNPLTTYMKNEFDDNIGKVVN
ncbi:hypothetical protein K9L04_00385 [Patescibacteria group bacterium]|nr:hypothetical protein [Patescibacteria group bacterium]